MSHGISGSSTRFPAARAVAAALWLVAATARGAEPAAKQQPDAMLHVTNGGFVAGTLVDSDEPGRIRWQPAAFAAPLDFFTNAVNAVHLPAPGEPPKVQGDTCLELAGGDIVSGTLLDLNDREAVLDVPRLGRIAIARSHVHRLTRLGDSAAVAFVGPAGLSGWHPPEPANGWREESGQLVSENEGAVLRSQFTLPSRALVEFELSWKRKPDFVLALGVDDSPKSLERAFRFEVWDYDLVVRCETDHEADVASLGAVRSGDGRGHFLAYLDQERGTLTVLSSGGKKLADLELKEKVNEKAAGLSLINNRGDVRLERLRVTRWTGDLPRKVEEDHSRILRADASTVPGQLVRFDAATKEFLVRDGSKETRLPEKELASAILSAPREDTERAVCVVGQDGTRLSGNLLKVQQGELWMSVPGVTGDVRFPVAALRSLLVLRHVPAAIAEKSAQTGTLELDGVRLVGQLAAGEARGTASCLAWKPDGSAAASPLRSDVAGRIVYRARPAPAPQQRARTQPQDGFVVHMMPGRAPLVRSPASSPTLPLALHLMTGDVIPCQVTKIDDKGVWFRSALSQGIFVAHEKIKAVELAQLERPPLTISKAKRERLLTLPRMQKESPPTHLVQSRNGDYLRGRVLKLDDATMQVEVRLETKEIPRNRVARVIWLHAEPSQGEPAAEKPNDKPNEKPDEEGGTRVQAVRSDGIRLTFRAEKFADAVLSGTSDVIGTCQVPLKDVDQLVIGSAIEREAAQLAYQRWKLQDAPEPKYVQADGTGSAGAESELVGKPAPDFTLDLLDGKTFHLADSKGKIVVLDFWATWCGPCLQAMPQVERATHEFADKGVQLIGVNLEEAPKTIQAMLERHKLNLTVALDRDGAVAGKYKANAIPQTVVIDREGNVSRVFVGSSPHLDDQLRDVLRGLMPEGAPDASKK